MQQTFGDEFMSKEEYLRYREQRSEHLCTAYQRLLRIPQETHIHQTKQMNLWLTNMRVGNRSQITKPYSSMDAYWKWILAVYGAQIVDKYCSVQIVDAVQVPLGVLSVMKAGKLRWQG